MNSHRLVPLLLAAPLVLLGCEKKAPSGAPAETSAARPAATAATKAKREKNPASPVVQLAEQVVKDCTWSSGRFDSDCKTEDTWRDKREELFDQGKADADLVSLLSDARPAMRYLGVDTLASSGHVYRTDAALAGELLDYAETETDEYVLARLGGVLSWIDFGKTKLVERARAVMKDDASPEMRAAFFGRVGSSNGNDQGVEAALRDMTIGAASSPNHALRAAALDGLRWFDATDAACAALAKGLADSKPAVVEAALDSAAKKCPTRLDAVLDAVEHARKPVFFSRYPEAVAEVCAKGSAEQKKRGRALAEEIGTTSESWISRRSALRAVIACDPAAGKAFAKRLAKDANEDVRKEAEKVLKGP